MRQEVLLCTPCFSKPLLASVLTVVLFTASFASALQIPLAVQNREQTARNAEPVTSGVPFAEGAVHSAGELKLLDGGREIPAQFFVTARWPDGSARWVLIDFQTDLGPGQTKTIVLETAAVPQPVTGITLSETPAAITVNTGISTIVLDKTENRLYGNSFNLIHGGTTYRAVPGTGSWTVEEQGPMKVVVRSEGTWYAGASLLRDSLIRFRSRFVFYRNKSDVRCYLTLQNNNALPWGLELPPGPPPLIISGAFFGAVLLPPGSYNVGPGVEKTWEVIAAAGGAVSVRDSRYQSNGVLDPRFTPPRPIAAAPPAYYSETGAWGKITPPAAASDGELQADLDLFERLQRAKVIAADVQDPPGLTGITLWGSLHQDIADWNHYGGLRWGGGFGPVSGNHYDWVYGMYLQFMRTGLLPFADAARVFAKHEIDFALYHTGADTAAFNFQKNWESRPSNDGPGNGFGGGRPSHTWLQGYALHWLLTGDPRGKDAYEELAEGLRQYVYESFNSEGYLRTRELRVPGWITENLVALWRIDPERVFRTSSYGTKRIPQVIKNVLRSVFDFEQSDGHGGYVYAGGEAEADPHRRQPLMNCYFLEPAVTAYKEVFALHDPVYAAKLRDLIRRMTDWLMSVTYGGSTNRTGDYLPRQIPYMVDIRLSAQTEGQIPYLLMAANAAGFLYLETSNDAYLLYARRAFQDYIRYLGAAGGDQYVNPGSRTAAAYNSSVYVETESKIHGWSSRYGQWYLAAERPIGVPEESGYLLWNGFLGMINILELVNVSLADAPVIVTLVDIRGNAVSQRNVPVPAGGQFDVIVNDLAGFTADSYGIAAVSFAAGTVSARMTFYRPAADGLNYDFAFAVPMAPPLRGPAGVIFNTHHPRRSPASADRYVANWLSLVNLDRTAVKTFDIYTYDQAGGFISSSAADVPALSRADISAGHELGEALVGYHQIMPSDPAAPYIAQLVRYGTAPGSFDFAVPSSGSRGVNGELWLPVSSGAAGENWIEVANPGEAAAEAVVRIYDNAGPVHQTSARLAAKAQAHFNASAALAPGFSGAARIIMPPGSSAVAQSVFYFHRLDGEVGAAYTSPLSRPAAGSSAGSYNLFLGMYDWLRLFNTQSTAQTLQLEVQGPGSIHSEAVVLPPYGGVDLGLHESSRFGTRPDSYGRIRISGLQPFVGEVIRLRPGPSGIDFIFSTPVLGEADAQ